ncbi:unnamed protein product [Clavelina lepadiformis]|uniref:C2H2-type domain-containing protein n=1 Tax=Clavelina lepadiformis TaxID=159417 RepID=A0ABP0FDR6_CLALP
MTPALFDRLYIRNDQRTQNMDTYWIPTSSAVVGTMPATNSIQPENCNKLKETDISVISQPTMVNFANIFAGATAAVASSATANSELHGGKNFMIGHAHGVPSLNQITIPPANQLSKRNGVFPMTASLPGMATINNLGMANANVIISGSSAPINDNLQQVVANQLTFTSSSQMRISVAKDFIQQAAAESGVTMAVNADGSSHMQPHVYAVPHQASQSTSSLSGGQLVPVATVPVTSSPEEDQNLKCSECNKTFKQAGQLSYHAFVAHAQLQARPHKCRSCPESFLEAHHLQDHVKAVHSNNDGQGGLRYTCSECQNSFDNGGHLNYHIYMAHTVQGSRTMPHICNECGKSFMKPNLLNAHMKNVHGTTNSIASNSNVTNTQFSLQLPDAGKQYACTDCDKVFKLPLYLKQHMLSSHDKPHKCEECGKGFGRRSDLNRHMRGVHMRERPHCCNKCGWTFAEAGNLKHHMLAVHSKEKNFRCSVCSKCFSISSYLKTHMVRVHGLTDNGKSTTITSTGVQQNNQQTFMLPNGSQNNPNLNVTPVAVAQSHVNRCFECGQVFANAAMLQNHVMSTHPQPFWCTVCGEGFSQAFQLQSHLQVRHTDRSSMSTVVAPVVGDAHRDIRAPTLAHVINPQSDLSSLTNISEAEKCATCNVYIDKNSKPHVCPGLKFQQAALTAAAAMAMAGERPHLCTKCGKGFKTATHLKQHVRCVHTKDRPHKCNHCSKTFARMSDLNRHVKGVHEKLKPATKVLRLMNLKCTECGAAFAETSQLKRHILTIHLHQRPCFKCADCQEGFPDETSFKVHICHEDERPHTCTVCNKRFAEPTQLRRHIRSAHSQHASQQQHKCFDCLRTFTRPVDLDRHIHAVHLKEKPHKCGYCGKFFGLHGNLNKHIRAVHMLEKPHQCVECGKCFAHIGVLKRHLRDIHFYDRRPAHSNPRTKNCTTNIMSNNQQQEQTQPHITVLQALEVIQQSQPPLQQQQQHTQPQQVMQSSHAAPLAVIHPSAQTPQHPHQVLQASSQVIQESLPQTPTPIT